MRDFITFWKRNFWKRMATAPNSAMTSMAMKMPLAGFSVVVATPATASTAKRRKGRTFWSLARRAAMASSKCAAGWVSGTGR